MYFKISNIKFYQDQLYVFFPKIALSLFFFITSSSLGIFCINLDCKIPVERVNQKSAVAAMIKVPVLYFPVLKMHDSRNAFNLQPQLLVVSTDNSILHFEKYAVYVSVSSFLILAETILLFVLLIKRVKKKKTAGSRQPTPKNQKNTTHSEPESSLKIIELQYRDILENIRIIAIQLDMGGNITFCNDFFLNLTGWGRAEITGKNWFKLFIPEEIREKIKKNFHMGISTGTLVVHYENEIIIKNQKKLLISWNNMVLMNEKGNITGVTAFGEDITRRKQTDQALIESEKRYKLLLESVTNYIYTVKIAEGKVVETMHGPGCEAVTGYTTEEFTANQYLWYQVIYGEDRKAVTEHASSLLSGVKAAPIEHRIVHKDGSIRWVTNTPVLHYDPHGELTAYDGLITDITDRKQAEEALRQAESRYRELFKNINSGVAVYEVIDNGRDFIFRDFNEAGEYMDGDKKENLIGKSIFNVRPGIEKFGLLEVFRQVWKTGVSACHPVTFYKDNNLTNWYENFVYKLPSGEIVAVFNNLTERKKAEEALYQSEAELKKAQRVAHVGSWTWDIKQNQLKWSDEMYNIFGIEKEKFAGSPADVISQAIHPADREKVEASNLSVIMQKKPVPLEYRVILSDRSIRTVWAEAGELLLDDKGNPALLTGIVQDITERKQSEEKIKEALLEKEALLRELYHRAKNNMQVICAMLSIQTNYIKDQHMIEIFREMENRIHSMALVHQKLYQSRNLSSINLEEYIHDLAGLLLSSYKVIPEQLKLVFDTEEVFVLIDIAIPCGLILNELISNALKHAFPDNKAGQVKIHLHRINKSLLEFTVSDNGAGFPVDFDLSTEGKMGLKTIMAIGENQLKGEVIFKSDQGITCTVRFNDTLYNKRV